MYSAVGKDEKQHQLAQNVSQQGLWTQFTIPLYKSWNQDN